MTTLAPAAFAPVGSLFTALVHALAMCSRIEDRRANPYSNDEELLERWGGVVLALREEIELEGMNPDSEASLSAYESRPACDPVLFLKKMGKELTMRAGIRAELAE